MATRIKIVWPSGSSPQARLSRFYAYSAIFHILLVVLFIFAPRLFGSSRANFSDDFLDVMYASLVADVGEEPVQPQVQPAQPKPKSPGKVAPEASGAELVLKYGDDEVGASIDPRWEALRKLKSDGIV